MNRNFLHQNRKYWNYKNFSFLINETSTRSKPQREYKRELKRKNRPYGVLTTKLVKRFHHRRSVQRDDNSIIKEKD